MFLDWLLFLSNNHYFCVSNKFNHFNTKKIMATTKITVNNNGSLKVEGDFEIVDAQGNSYGLDGRTTLGLCRCGLSKNKPFCDGSHKSSFEHEPVAFDLPPRKV